MICQRLTVLASFPHSCDTPAYRNTCFMNSALQCLSNSSLLREYFASGDYAEDINEENPMGTGGKVGCSTLVTFSLALPVFFFYSHSSLSISDPKHFSAR